MMTIMGYGGMVNEVLMAVSLDTLPVFPHGDSPVFCMQAIAYTRMAMTTDQQSVAVVIPIKQS